MKKKTPNYYCLHCPHSGAMHSGPQMRCGGLDAAGDVCDCSPFVADISRSPMPDMHDSKSQSKRLAIQKGIKGPNPGDPPLRLPVIQQRYRIVSDDSGHEYYIKVGEEKAFYAWVEAAENYDQDYDGPDFEENRIEGRFTFTDPRND